MKKIIIVFLILLFYCLPAAAKTLNIDIYGPGQSAVNLYIAPPVLSSGQSISYNSSLPSTFRKLLLDNLQFLPFFNFIDSEQIVGGGKLKSALGKNIDFKKFNLSKVDLLISILCKNSEDNTNIAGLEVRAYEVFSGSFMLGKAYSVKNMAQLPLIASRFSAALMRQLTGKGDFFETKLAYVQRVDKHKQIFSISPQGHDKHQLTDLQGISLSPSWSWDGRQVAFVFINNREHRLAVWSKGLDKVQTWSMPGNTCISPVFTPQEQIALSIDPEGSPNIYLLNDKYQLEKELVKSWAIDISPSFDRLGDKMSFISSRLGNPHVFVLYTKTGEVQRITYQGKYNTGAAISPDGTKVAFSRMVEGNHRIFIIDIASGQEKQISFGPGNDEDPTWSPDSYFIAFSSNRSGTYRLYLTTVHGDEPKEIPTGAGEATAPSWGPSLDD